MAHGLQPPTGERLHIGAEHAGARLDKTLAALLPGLSRERIKALLASGHISLEGGQAILNGKSRISGPIDVHIIIPQADTPGTVAQPIALNIAYEDDHLIVVDKPAGMVVHPAAGNPDGTLVNALLHHCAGKLAGIGGVARPGIVHRIDKDTSGLLVVAKDDHTHAGLAAQFARHSIHRRYDALVHGHPASPAGTISSSIGRSASHRKKMAVVEEGRGKHAVTHYQLVARLREASHVRCTLETGRTHQIRVHMAHLGHGLLGDPLYGAGRGRKGMGVVLADLGFKRQALHAAELGFVHPASGAEIRLESSIPDDMARLIEKLRL